jgi:hypothetical protein
MSVTKINEVEINGIIYVPKSSTPKPAKGEYPIYMVRTYSAGVFYGELKSREGKEAVLLNARRVWYWVGAASLSQLAQSGTVCPDKCKFPETVSYVILTEVIELIPVTDAALTTLNAVAIWKR